MTVVPYKVLKTKPLTALGSQESGPERCVSVVL